MITQQYLRSILDYNPETGVFIWLHRDDVKPEWNTRWAGKAAGSLMVNGYVKIAILGKIFFAHRLAFLYMEGETPKQVDHIDGNRANNKWSNLRAVDNYINSRNQKLRNTNTSGHNGVYWCKRRLMWYVRIGLNGKNLHGGYFQNKDDAIKARADLDIKYNYHLLHGNKKGA